MERDSMSAKDSSASQRTTILAHAEVTSYATLIAFRDAESLPWPLPDYAIRRGQQLKTAAERLTTRELVALLADAVDRVEGGK